MKNTKNKDIIENQLKNTFVLLEKMLENATDDMHIKGIEEIILNFKDITDYIKYQQELNESKLRAEESNRLKTQFMAIASHEIRTSANGIIGLVDLLEETHIDNTQKEYINMLSFSADRLLLIINNILDISKIEEGKFQKANRKFNLLKLLKNTFEYFKLQANKKDLEFYYKINKNIPDTIIGDFNRLSQVLFNIIGNAIKFTKKGCICLEIEVYYEDIHNIEVKFIVKDTGIGIPSSKIDSIFERFNQLDASINSEYGGTGLGLNISKKLVELMGGEIDVSSQQGKGSIFSFSLKFLKDNSEKQNIKPPDLGKGVQENDDFLKLNILVAEDDLVNQKIIKNILKKDEWTVTIVSNGKETLEYLENHNIDVTLMDIYMPKMNGFEVSRIIRKRELITGKHMPIIALTAAAMKEDMEKCLEIGMDGYISKPIRSNIVCQTIFDVLKRQSVIGDLNIKQLLNRIDGNTDVLKEIIEDVISDEYEKEHLGNMEAYIEKEDMKTLCMQMHKFKGSISNFGAYNIINILQKMNDSINAKDLYTVRKLFKELKMEFNKAKSNLMKYNDIKTLNNLKYTL